MRDGFRREVRFQQDESRNKGRDGVDPGPGYSSAGCSPGTVKSGLNSGEKGWRQMVEGTQSARAAWVNFHWSKVGCLCICAVCHRDYFN